MSNPRAARPFFNAGQRAEISTFARIPTQLVIAANHI
jgi:hypothetical protein